MNRLEGKAVIVTGVARGIGKAIAEACSAEGASLILIDTDEAVNEVATGPRTHALVGDVRDAELAAQAVAEAVSRYGGLDGLVNNVALVEEGDIMETDQKIWNDTIAINVEAPLRWIQAAIPAMLNRGEGVVVNISSTEGIVARPDHCAYVTSKAALNGLTRSVAIDYGRKGVRANSISPGSVESEKFREYVALDPAMEEELISYNYRGRIGRPQEIAACCVYLLSDDSGFVNGADYIIDGGRTAGS